MVPHGQSTPIIVASESDCGSSYASPCDPSMTDSQSRKHRCLSGFTPSLRSVCLAPSSLSSPHSSVSVVGGSGSCTSFSSSDMEELVGPQSNDLGHLIGNARHIIFQGYGRPLLGPCKIVGEAMRWNPLCFVLGWVICQDAPLEH